MRKPVTGGVPIPLPSENDFRRANEKTEIPSMIVIVHSHARDDDLADDEYEEHDVTMDEDIEDMMEESDRDTEPKDIMKPIATSAAEEDMKPARRRFSFFRFKKNPVLQPRRSFQRRQQEPACDTKQN